MTDFGDPIKAVAKALVPIVAAVGIAVLAGVGMVGYEIGLHNAATLDKPAATSPCPAAYGSPPKL